MRMASFLDNRTESSIINSFIHPPFQSVSIRGKQSGAGSEEDPLCRYKLRFFAPRFRRTVSKGYAPQPLQSGKV